MPTLVGQPAPDFTSAAVLPDGAITQTYNLANASDGRYALVFFYPFDFTFVCPAAFVVDRDRIVRAALIHDLPLGRNIDELLRLFDALRLHEQRGEVCPANWRPGEPGMEASPAALAAYLAADGELL